MSELIERVQDEADLCHVEGAEDIAKLLDEVAVEFAQLSAELDMWHKTADAAQVRFEDATIENAEMREALSEASRVIRHAWIDGAHEDARIWLVKYPEESDE